MAITVAHSEFNFGEYWNKKSSLYFLQIVYLLVFHNKLASFDKIYECILWMLYPGHHVFVNK